MAEDIIIEQEYREWISDVSHRFKQSQIKAAMKVNDEMLRFYWSLGKEMHSRKNQYAWVLFCKLNDVTFRKLFEAESPLVV